MSPSFCLSRSVIRVSLGSKLGVINGVRVREGHVWPVAGTR